MNTIEERLETIFQSTKNSTIEPADSTLSRTYTSDSNNNNDDDDDDVPDEHKRETKTKVKLNYKNIESFNTISRERTKQDRTYHTDVSGIQYNTQAAASGRETEGFQSGTTSEKNEKHFKKFMKVLKKIISFFKDFPSKHLYLLFHLIIRKTYPGPNTIDKKKYGKERSKSIWKDIQQNDAKWLTKTTVDFIFIYISFYLARILYFNDFLQNSVAQEPEQKGGVGAMDLMNGTEGLILNSAMGMDMGSDFTGSGDFNPLNFMNNGRKTEGKNGFSYILHSVILGLWNLGPDIFHYIFENLNSWINFDTNIKTFMGLFFFSWFYIYSYFTFNINLFCDSFFMKVRPFMYMLFSLNIVYYVINIAKDPSLLQAISSLSYFVFIVFLIYIVISALIAPIGQLYFSIVIIYFFIKLAFKYMNRNLRTDTDGKGNVIHPLMKFFIEPTSIEQPPVSTSQTGGNSTPESEPPKSKLQYSKLFFLFMLPHFIGNDKNSYINTTPNIMKIPNILFIVLFIFFTWKMIELIVGYTNTDVKISGIKGSSFFIILFFITAVIWIFLIIHFAKLFKYLKELVEQNKYTIKANSNYEPFNLLGTNNMLNMASKAATGDIGSAAKDVVSGNLPIPGLNPEQLKGLNPEQLEKYLPKNIPGLNPEQLEKYLPKIPGIDPSKLEEYPKHGSVDLNSLYNQNINFMNNSALNLNPSDIKGIDIGPSKLPIKEFANVASQYLK